MEFMLDHLREIARAFFKKKVQLVVDTINAHIEALKKEVADLEARREHLLSGVVGPSRFGDQNLFFSFSFFVSFPYVYFLFLFALPSTLPYFSSIYLISLT